VLGFFEVGMRLKSFGGLEGGSPQPSGPDDFVGGFGRSQRHQLGASSNSKKIVITILGVVWVSLFSAIAVRTFTSSEGTAEAVAAVQPPKAAITIEKPAQVDKIEVLIPVKDIQPNALLQPADFIRVSRPAAAIRGEVVSSYGDLRGSYARELLPANLPLMRGSISTEPPLNPVIQNIPVGFRAVSISVNATTGVEGWARAGARVDVQWVGVLRTQKVARRLVENTKILSAERKLDPKADPLLPVPTTVTLLVPEKDAQRVSLAQSAGTLVLLLRGAQDVRGSSDDGSLTWSDLLNGGATASESNVQGVVRVREKDGAQREFAIIDGTVLKRKRE
jgi:Flp pilus assembly protein CpaB